MKYSNACILVVIAVTLLACNTPQQNQVNVNRQAQLEIEAKARAAKQIAEEAAALPKINATATLPLAEWNALIGKTPNQVIELMGKPDRTSVLFRTETWYYDSCFVVDPIENIAGIVATFNTTREKPDAIVKNVRANSNSIFQEKSKSGEAKSATKNEVEKKPELTPKTNPDPMPEPKLKPTTPTRTELKVIVMGKNRKEVELLLGPPARMESTKWIYNDRTHDQKTLLTDKVQTLYFGTGKNDVVVDVTFRP